MVYILATSFVQYAIDLLSPEQQSTRISLTISRTEVLISTRKIRENLLSKHLKVETEIVVRHDVLNNSICRHKNNNYRPLSVPGIIRVLKTLQDKLSALVYCRRDRRTDKFDSIRELAKSNSIQAFGN